MQHLGTKIDSLWDIQETPDSELRQMGYPFCVVHTGASGHQTWFQCRSIEEAHAKLNAIHQELDRMKRAQLVA